MKKWCFPKVLGFHFLDKNKCPKTGKAKGLSQKGCFFRSCRQK